MRPESPASPRRSIWLCRKTGTSGSALPATHEVEIDSGDQLETTSAPRSHPRT